MPVDPSKGFGLKKDEQEIYQAYVEMHKHKQAENQKAMENGPTVSQQYEKEEAFDQLYTDASYLPPEFTHPALELIDEGISTTYRVKKDQRIAPREVLFVSRPLVYTEHPITEIPDPTYLLTHIQSNPPTPNIRRALSTLPCTSPSHTRQPAVPKNLDMTLAASDETVPNFDSDTWEALIGQHQHFDQSHDLALLSLRREKPRSFAGIWLQRALMQHSCAPNTHAIFIGDRMIVRATSEILDGEDLTVNKIQGYAGCPLEVREAKMRQMGIPMGECFRDHMESEAPEAVREQLRALHEAYVGRNNSVAEALQRGDSSGIAAVQQRMQGELQKLEEAVDRACEDRQDRSWLLASALKSYELVAALGRLLQPGMKAAQRVRDVRWLVAVLDLLAAVVPGSDEHMMTAVQGLKVLEGNFEELRQRKPGTAKKLSSHISDAIIARYGEVDEETTGRLLDALLRTNTALDGYAGGTAGTAAAGSGAFDTEEVEQWMDAPAEGEAEAEADGEGEALADELLDMEALGEEEEDDLEERRRRRAEVAGGEGVSKDLLKSLEEEQKEMLLL